MILSIIVILTILGLNSAQDICGRPEPTDCDPLAEFRKIDGSCNNEANPLWGSAGSAFVRWIPDDYNDPDGISTPADNGREKANAREVAEKILTTVEEMRDRDMQTGPFSMLFTFWGQLISHDMSLSGEKVQDRSCWTKKLNDPKPIDLCYNIDGPNTCPTGNTSAIPIKKCKDANNRDGRFQAKVHVFNRTNYCTNVVAAEDVREQLNKETAFIDASVVYGVDQTFLDTYLKDPAEGWKLKSNKAIPNHENEELLPYDTTGHMFCFPDLKNNSSPCFLTGDPRGNDVPDLMALQTILLREHNRIADHFKNKTSWADGVIFEKTRKILGAILQKITYENWLPYVLGSEISEINETTSYDSGENPSLLNGFSTGAMRFGHPLLVQSQNYRDHNYKNNKKEAEARGLPNPFGIAKSFWITDQFLLFTKPIESKLRGSMDTHAKDIDIRKLYNHYITNALFSKAYNPNQDLGSRNIQRGRDHGLPGFNAYRVNCGLSNLTDWTEVSDIVREAPSDPSVKDTVVQHLENMYVTPEKIDLYIGGLVEKPQGNGLLGPTFTCILKEQFKRLKAGDSFFYTHSEVFTEDQLKEIQKYSLGKLLCNNFHDHPTEDQAHLMPDNPFFRVSRKLEDASVCLDIADLDLSKWYS